MAKKHTPKPSSPLIPCRCVINGRKEASHGLLTPHPVHQVLKWTYGVHTHLYYIPRGPTPKEEGPLNGEGPASALPTPPDAPQSLHHLSFEHVQGNTLGSNPMR
jgi:hypothetical protein